MDYTKYFVAFLPTLDAEKSKEIRPQHIEYLKKMKDEGKIFLNGRFPDGTGGLVVYQAETLEEAESYAKNDPFVIHKARGCEVHEWEMVK
jgi:uncharacterized protein YciI